MRTIHLILISLVLITATGMANDRGYNDDYTYARVVDVQPVYDTYQIPERRRVCDDNYRGRDRNVEYKNNGGGALLGGIIGGLIGNRFGKGHGRRAATAVGVIAGASIGSKARPRGYYSNNHRSRKQCYSRTEYRQEQRLTGYDVSYDYNGKIYQTRLQNHPGDRIRVQVNVQVAEY